MPAKSEKQYRAMQAAAHGKSTLGIPKKVGKEFVKHGPPKKGKKKKTDGDDYGHMMDMMTEDKGRKR